MQVCEGCWGARSEGDDSAVVELAGAGRSCRKGGLRPSGLALKGKAAALVLTEGPRQPGLQRRRSATRSRGESRAALGEDLMQSISRLLGSSVWLPECL